VKADEQTEMSSEIYLTARLVSAALELLGMTQEQLAAAAGLSKHTVTNFIRANHTPQDSTIAAIRDALEKRGIIFTNGDTPGVKLDRSKAIIPT
jgi:transcriptional regulator with XRE-family HTH domain